MGRKVSESWLGTVVSLALVVTLMGGVPAYMAVTSADAPMLLWLFPALAAIIAGLMVWRLVRAGFVLTPQGIEGAHELGKGERLSWDEVSGFEWEMSRTSSSNSDGSSRPTYRLLAVTDRGGVRITSLSASARTARRMTGELVRAREDGTIPPHVEVHRPLTAGEMFRAIGSAVGLGDAAGPFSGPQEQPGTSDPIAGSGRAPDTSLPPPPSGDDPQGSAGP